MVQLFWHLRHPRRTVSDWAYARKWMWQRALSRLVIVGTERMQHGISYPSGMEFEDAEWEAAFDLLKEYFWTLWD